MTEAWSVRSHDGYLIPHSYGEEAEIKPGTFLTIMALRNLRAVIESEIDIKPVDIKPVADDAFSFFDGYTPSIFWAENKGPASNGRTYVFETRYCSTDEILPPKYLSQIPRRLSRRFLRSVPQKVSDLKDRLIGSENNGDKILKRFYEFCVEHQKRERPTSGKPVEELMEEYEREGYFYGNCKEASNFYAALCNAAGFPAKKVFGRTPIGGHCWTDVIVPTEDGWKLLAVDPALGCFGDFKYTLHQFIDPSPDFATLLRSIFRIRKPKTYMLKIQFADEDESV